MAAQGAVKGHTQGTVPAFFLHDPLHRVDVFACASSSRQGGHSLFFVCGDFMSASRLGNVHKGAHMVHLFNEMGVDYGTIVALT